MLCESYAISIDFFVADIGLVSWLHFLVLWQEMLRICAFFSRVSKDSFSPFFRIGVLKKLCIRHPSAINVVGGQVCVTRRATTNNTSKARRTLFNRPTLGPRWMICTFYMWGWHRARNTYLGASKNRFYLFFKMVSQSALLQKQYIGETPVFLYLLEWEVLTNQIYVTYNPTHMGSRNFYGSRFCV